jgi:hypothetical protein
MSVALAIQNVNPMRHIVICGLSGCTTFFYTFTYKQELPKKVIKQKMCILIFFAKFFPKHFSLKKNSVGYYYKCTQVLT